MPRSALFFLSGAFLQRNPEKRTSLPSAGTPGTKICLRLDMGRMISWNKVQAWSAASLLRTLRGLNTASPPRVELCVLTSTRNTLLYCQLDVMMGRWWCLTFAPRAINLFTCQRYEPTNTLIPCGRWAGTMRTTQLNSLICSQSAQMAESWTGVSWRIN